MENISDEEYNKSKDFKRVLGRKIFEKKVEITFETDEQKKKV